MSPDDCVHVVDDDPAMRESVAFLLQSAGYRSRTYPSADALLVALDKLERGCILTDVRMPGMNGLDLVHELKRLGNLTPIVVFTGHADVTMAVAAMKAGVVDFLEKPFSDDALLRAIGAALARVEDTSDNDRVRREVEARFATLTAREREVFEAVASGDSNKEAARKLGISPRTVEIYRANVMTKMDAATLSDLVRMSLLRA